MIFRYFQRMWRSTVILAPIAFIICLCLPIWDKLYPWKEAEQSILQHDPRFVFCVGGSFQSETTQNSSDTEFTLNYLIIPKDSLKPKFAEARSHNGSFSFSQNDVTGPFLIIFFLLYVFIIFRFSIPWYSAKFQRQIQP